MIDAISDLERSVQMFLDVDLSMRDVVLILLVVVVTVLAKVQQNSIDELRREIRKARNSRFDFE